MGAHDCPFEVGQQVEARSFQEGFRGAWFRSKIKDVSCRKGLIGCVLEYLDFPDEKDTWTKLYQKPPTFNNRKAKQKDLEIMIRPCFPPVYHESQMPNVSAISEAIVVVNDAWKVGDLVDWWKDDCYWSGRLSQRLKDEKFQVDLLPPPLGEGLSYEVCYKDLRPSLDWSLEAGWTVPTPMNSSNGQCCAWIVNPFNKGRASSSKARTAVENRDIVQGIAGASQSSVPSHVSSRSSKPSYGRTPSSKVCTVREKRDGAQVIAGTSQSSVPSYLSSPSSKPSCGSTPSLKARAGRNNRDGVQGIAEASKSLIPSHVSSPSTKPSNGSSPSSKAHTASENRDRVKCMAGASRSSGPSYVSFHSSKSAAMFEVMEKHTLGATGAEKEMHTPGSDVDLDMTKGDSGGTSCLDLDSDSGSHAKARSIGMGDETSVGKDRIVNGEEIRGVSSSSSKPPNKLEEIKKRLLGVTTEKEMHTGGTKTDANMENGSLEKTSSSDNGFSSDIKAGLTSLERDGLNDGRPLKKMRTNGNIPLNLMFSDTTEDAILDLEELVNRVKWMKSLLEIATCLSNTTRPLWKFLGHLGSSPPK